MTLQFFQIAKGGNYERLSTQTKAAPMDRPGAENHREHNNNILLCVLVNSHIVGDLMSVTKYNFKKPKINRQELELLNWFLAHTNDNPLINPDALELFKAHGFSAMNYQDLVNKIKTILKTYKTKGNYEN